MFLPHHHHSYSRLSLRLILLCHGVYHYPSPHIVSSLNSRTSLVTTRIVASDRLSATFSYPIVSGLTSGDIFSVTLAARNAAGVSAAVIDVVTLLLPGPSIVSI